MNELISMYKSTLAETNELFLKKMSVSTIDECDALISIRRFISNNIYNINDTTLNKFISILVSIDDLVRVLTENDISDYDEFISTYLSEYSKLNSHMIGIAYVLISIKYNIKVSIDKVLRMIKGNTKKHGILQKIKNKIMGVIKRERVYNQAS